ncbi:MAG: hypothetical protein EOP18_09665 [Rhizobiaceae bacterium]|nr:MAG: hypothetical protein EOP18_09665 [Rhizobiaceae bacterium]
MIAFIMVSAAAIVSAQPVTGTRDGLIGPVRHVGPTVEQVRYYEQGGEPRIAPVALDLSDVAEGAQLRFRGAQLKLKVPI